MGQAHGRFGTLQVLAAGAGGPVYVDAHLLFEGGAIQGIGRRAGSGEGFHGRGPAGVARIGSAPRKTTGSHR